MNASWKCKQCENINFDDNTSCTRCGYTPSHFIKQQQTEKPSLSLSVLSAQAMQTKHVFVGKCNLDEYTEQNLIDLVFGFSREIQQLLPSYNAYYNIPSAIPCLCINYIWFKHRRDRLPKRIAFIVKMDGKKKRVILKYNAQKNIDQYNMEHTHTVIRQKFGINEGIIYQMRVV
eukprot:329513_1